MTTRLDCERLDAEDPLATLREQFALPADKIYLDGNSLGVLPKTAAARVQQVVQNEWGNGLIRSWNSAGWMALPQRVGDKIGRLIGAAPGETVSDPIVATRPGDTRARSSTTSANSAAPASASRRRGIGVVPACPAWPVQVS